MKTEDLYKQKNECCGCELCSQSCPKNIITMKPDDAGFMYPIIEDDSTCISCKKCLSVCPMKSPGKTGNEVIRSFSFSMNDSNDLKKSASGGLITEICRRFILLGGVVYGTEYTDNYMSVSYSRATTLQALEKFRGSKYVQAGKKDIYKSVTKDINNGLLVLFVGLPCDISALYHAVRDISKLYTIALICHGPTSQKVHRDYCKSIQKEDGEIIKFMSVRYKVNGWRPYHIHTEYENGRIFEEQFNKTDYNTAFLYMKRPSCRVCHYKAENEKFGISADLIAGDFHGVKYDSLHYNKWGVSQCSIMSEKGEYLASLLKSDYKLLEIPYSIIRSSNRGMYMSIPQRGSYEKFVTDYSKHSLNYACHSLMVVFFNFIVNMSFLFVRVMNIPQKIKRFFHR